MNGDLEQQLEQHRVPLTGYCYRMLGSAFEAEDAVQETLVRAWRALDRFEGRSSLRSWLYKIATHVCLDMSASRQRRARPMALSPVGSPDGPVAPPLPEATWITPIPDDRVLPADGDPSEVVARRQTIRLAFVAALQHLPPRQRAVLVLCEVLSYGASEVAELLDTTVASVNSALQRARSTLSALNLTPADTAEPLGEVHQALLNRYVDAFERYDLASLTTLLHEDATLSMPPYPLWLRGHDHIRRWLLGPGAQCRGSRLIPVAACGSPAFGQYRPSGPGGRHEPWGLQVLEVANGQILGLNTFLVRPAPIGADLDTATLFPLFGLPASLDA